MEGKSRHYFPGGNTPLGFYSYYENILSQKEAERIYCLKGGPGTGKSTLMKQIGNYFFDKGEHVDYLWCSSDPDSLDGIVIKDHNTAIIDGTYPHMIDPINPGAVDEIIDLGIYWDRKGIREYKNEIISCGEKISKAFKTAYGYLKSAACKNDVMSHMLRDHINEEIIRETIERIDTIPMKKGSEGNIKRFFASAITPKGIKNTLTSLIDEACMNYVIEVPEGFENNSIFKPIMSKLISYGYDTEVFCCPMDPENKIEHMISKQAGIGIFTSNMYHEVDIDMPHIKRIRIEPIFSDGFHRSSYEEARRSASEDIFFCVNMLAYAKQCHDELENYYIPNMDFKKIHDLGNYLINEIEMI